MQHTVERSPLAAMVSDGNEFAYTSILTVEPPIQSGKEFGEKNCTRVALHHLFTDEKQTYFRAFIDVSDRKIALNAIEQLHSHLKNVLSGKSELMVAAVKEGREMKLFSFDDEATIRSNSA